MENVEESLNDSTTIHQEVNHSISVNRAADHDLSQLQRAWSPRPCRLRHVRIKIKISVGCLFTHTQKYLRI